MTRSNHKVTLLRFAFVFFCCLVTTLVVGKLLQPLVLSLCSCMSLCQGFLGDVKDEAPLHAHNTSSTHSLVDLCVDVCTGCCLRIGTRILFPRKLLPQNGNMGEPQISLCLERRRACGFESAHQKQRSQFKPAACPGPQELTHDHNNSWSHEDHVI